MNKGCIAIPDPVFTATEREGLACVIGGILREGKWFRLPEEDEPLATRECDDGPV